MGLDIFVYKVLSPDPNNINYFSIEDSVLNIFNNQSYLRIIEYLNIEQGKINSGLDLEAVRLFSIFGDIGTYVDASGKEVKVELPIITQEERVITTKEIGYQRKGANSKFYKDIGTDDIVLDKTTLLLHWNNYFSDTPKDREEFYSNIVSKFENGITFMSYSW